MSRVSVRQIQDNSLCSLPAANSDSLSGYDSFIFKTKSSSAATALITKEIFVNGVPLTMELDTGSARSLISHSIYKYMFKTDRPVMCNTDTLLYAYGGVPLEVIGEIKENLFYSLRIFT